VTVFGQVHGAWHRGWHWHLVVAELAARGYRSVAVDLPTEEPGAGAEAYAATVVDALDGVDDVVLVAHSLGGLVAPVVAQVRPVRALVLVAPLLPEPGVSWDEQSARERDLLHRGLGQGQLPGPDGSSSWQVGAAVRRLYPDAPPDLALAAARRLRPQYWRVSREPTPLVGWPAVLTMIVACAGDSVLNSAALRRVVHARAAATGPNRLAADLVELPGDHSPFLARPAQLVDLLTTAAAAPSPDRPAI